MNAPGRNSARGAALITTLVIVSAIALIVVGVFSVSRQEAITTGSVLSKTRAKLASEAAIADASSLLRSLTNDDHYLVTTAIEGSGPNLTRYYFVTKPQPENLLHVPLFSGGEADQTSMPTLNSTTTARLATVSAATPSIRWANRDANERIQLSPLTHLSADGVPFKENPFPATGFVELDTPPANPGGRANEPKSRYAYWIEDLEGFPSLDAVEAPTPHFVPSENGISDQTRGGYSRFDSRTQPEDPAESGLRLAFADDPQVFYQFPKTVRGQSRLDQIVPGLSPGDQPFLPWNIAGMEQTEHPFSALSNRALKPFVPPENETDFESDRFSSGLVPYLSRPMIPYGHQYADEGLVRYNINLLVADADMTVASIIEDNLPDFEQRKGGFLQDQNTGSAIDYINTIAANLLDYADTDSLPSNPATTTNNSGSLFRGVDGYAPVNEFFIEFEYSGYKIAGGEYTVIFTARIFAEFWNTFRRPITMNQLTLDFEFLDEPQFTCFTTTWELERDQRTRNEPLESPVPSLSLEPNEIRVVPFGEIRWEVPVGNPGSLPVAFPIIEDFRAGPSAGSVNPRANYQLYLDSHLVDTGGRSPDGRDDAHGFFFNRQSRLNQDEAIMRVGGSTPRLKAHGSGTGSNTSGHGIQGTTLGDPWMNHYVIATWDNFRYRTSEYRNHASPGQRNLSTNLVPSSRVDSPSDQTRVRDWPDGGYDNSLASNPTSDSQEPDDTSFVVRNDPRHAPWTLSNRGRFFSVSEFGHIHDPAMWVYGDPDATRYLGSQSYRDESDRTLPNPSMLSLPAAADPNPRWGGGNTLRIGRPEHELFDQPGMRASQLLDLFHVGINGTNLTAANASEAPLLYENFDPILHRQPPTAIDASAALNEPFASLYEPEHHAQSPFQSQWGRLNINTAPTLFELQAFLRGPLVTSDVVVDDATEDSPITPEYTDEATLEELTKRLNPLSIPAIALGLYEARPFYSPSHLARVFSELIKRHDALPEHYNDAEAEETFARLLNTTSLSSRHFRIHTYAETYEPTTETILARDRRAYDVFIEPIRDSNGDIESTKLRILRVISP